MDPFLPSSDMQTCRLPVCQNDWSLCQAGPLEAEVGTSEEIERRLEPLYRRLRLPEGRLELMTGIRERRFWEAGVLPSDKSIASGELAIAGAGIERRDIGGADPRIRLPRLPRTRHGLPHASRLAP